MLFRVVVTDEKQKKNNSKAELEKVSEENYILIYKYCKSRLNASESDSYDITNDVFLLLCEKWDHLEKDNIKAWLYRTADNRLMEFSRKNRKTMNEFTYIDDLDDFTINNLSYEQNFNYMSDDDIEKNKDEILNELPGKDRKLFEMVFIEKLPYETICKELSISKDNLRTRVYRLRQKINEAVYVKIHK